FIEHNRKDLVNLESVRREAFYRLKKYPGQISQNLHRAQVIIPRKLALILHENPARISDAVKAFYLCDHDELQILQTNQIEKLIFPPNDPVRCVANFSKVGFAQIRSQQFQAPGVWTQVVGQNSSGSLIMAVEVGMKLTYGFELLVSGAKNRDLKAVREIELILEDIDNGDLLLPSDAEIGQWKSIEDDDSWLDINYEDFERELSGRCNEEKNTEAGFGDQTTHGNLRELVSRFEDFSKDDNTGFDGTELEEMDNDMSESSDSGSGTPAANTNTDSEEADFTKMMREILDMSKETMRELMGPSASEGVGTTQHGNS
ncbi:MAG: hypothetical protein LQ340_006913, partial [Diploschistes diacapsis]